MSAVTLPRPVARIRTFAGDAAAARRLEQALELVRLRTGLLWEHAAERDGDAALSVLYGPEPWARAKAAEVDGACLVIPATGRTGPADAAAAGRVDEVGPELHVLAGDAPAIMSELVRPVQGQMTSMREQCHPTLPLEEPWVDRLAEELAARVAALLPPGAVLYRLPPLPGGATWGIALSHDMDYVVTTPRYRATRLYYLAYGLRGPVRPSRVVRHHLRALTSPRPWMHADAAAAEEAAGATSEWFVFARHGAQRGLHATLFNPEYRVGEVRALLHRLRDAGHVIGLHASPEAGADPSLLAVERDLLAEAAGTPVTGVRHHMGRCVWPLAPRGWREAGFEYDSSFIVNDAQGYRLGTAGAVPLEDEAVELSPSWMDTVAFNYESKEPEVLLAELHALVDRARGRGGVEGVVWHDIPMGRDYPGVALYREFLRYARDRGGFIGPCAAFARHSIALREARLEGDSLERGDVLRDFEPEQVGPPLQGASVGVE